MKREKYPYDPQLTTVQVAADWVRSNVQGGGASCPCCGQIARVYRRRLYSTMAYALILIHKTPSEGGWVHVPSVLNGHGAIASGGDVPKLVHWGLLEASPKGRGRYRVTKRGQDFIECRIVVPATVLLFDGARLDYDESEMLTITEALGPRYKYDELMQDV